jgi:hypothetical protein
MCKDEETRPVPFAGRNTISWNKNEVLLLAGRTSNVTDREEEAYERMWRFYEGGERTAACKYDISFWKNLKVLTSITAHLKNLKNPKQ